MRYEIRNGGYTVAACGLGRGFADLPIVITLAFVCVFLTHLVGGEMSLYTTEMLFFIVGLHGLAVEGAAKLLSIIVPGRVNCVMYAFIVALQISCITEYLIRGKDVLSPVFRVMVRYSVNNIALRAVVSVLYGGPAARETCQCRWDEDEWPDWMRCMKMPTHELFYTD